MKLIVYFDLLVTADYFCGAGHSYVIPLVDRKWATCQEGQEDGSFIFLHTQCLNMCLSPHKLFETFKTKQQQQQILQHYNEQPHCQQSQCHADDAVHIQGFLYLRQLSDRSDK